LASEVAKLAAAMNSLEDARMQLSEMGVKLSVKQIATIAYQFCSGRGCGRRPAEWGFPRVWQENASSSVPTVAE
jgi:hypothetical protein